MCTPISHAEYALYDEGFRKDVIRQARNGQKGALDTLRAVREHITAERSGYPAMVAEVNRFLDEIEAEAAEAGAREMVTA